MAAFEHVTVTGQWDDPDANNGAGAFAAGNFLFSASGTLMDDGATAIVTPVVIGQLDSTGSLWNGVTTGSGVSLLSSDNFLEDQLNWHFLLRIQGFPTIDVADVVVNFSDGATQGIFDILAKNGWTKPTV